MRTATVSFRQVTFFSAIFKAYNIVCKIITMLWVLHWNNQSIICKATCTEPTFVSCRPPWPY